MLKNKYRNFMRKCRFYIRLFPFIFQDLLLMLIINKMIYEVDN
jgi:hypothetical protein